MLSITIIRRVLDYQDNEQHDFDDRSKGRLKQNPRNFGHLSRKLLSSKSQQIGDRDHRNVAQSKDPEMQLGRNEMENDGNRDKGPEDIHPH